MSYEIYIPGGQFGGSNNFLAQLGSIGDDWGYGFDKTLQFNNNLMRHQQNAALTPSAIRAGIAQNINTQSANELDHYGRLPVIQAVSQALGGQQMSSQQQDLMRMFGYGANVNAGGAYGMNVQATPTYTQTGGSLQTTPAQWQTPATSNALVPQSSIQGLQNHPMSISYGNHSGVGL